MIRSKRRTDEYEVLTQIIDPEFIRPPREAQRRWLLNRALKEYCEDLEALDNLASRFAEGTGVHDLALDRGSTDLEDHEIMEDWQVPIMVAMSSIVTASHGDVLEVGFGRGVSASMIQEAGVHSHSIIECNASIIRRFHKWKIRYPQADIRLLEGRWQDVENELETYDGVFFHTYPLNLDEYVEYVNNSVTFAESFFGTASSVLRPGGVFTYLTNEIDSLSRSHQRLLLRHFREFSVSLQGLSVPQDVGDMWWADSMAVVKATK